MCMEGKFAALADWDKAAVQPVGQRTAEYESAGVDCGDVIRRAGLVAVGQKVDDCNNGVISL